MYPDEDQHPLDDLLCDRRFIVLTLYRKTGSYGVPSFEGNEDHCKSSSNV